MTDYRECAHPDHEGQRSLPPSGFHKSNNGKNRNWCRECHTRVTRENRLKREARERELYTREVMPARIPWHRLGEWFAQRPLPLDPED